MTLAALPVGASRITGLPSFWRVLTSAPSKAVLPVPAYPFSTSVLRGRSLASSLLNPAMARS